MLVRVLFWVLVKVLFRVLKVPRLWQCFFGDGFRLLVRVQLNSPQLSGVYARCSICLTRSASGTLIYKFVKEVAHSRETSIRSYKETGNIANLKIIDEEPPSGETNLHEMGGCGLLLQMHTAV